MDLIRPRVFRRSNVGLVYIVEVKNIYSNYRGVYHLRKILTRRSQQF